MDSAVPALSLVDDEDLSNDVAFLNRFMDAVVTGWICLFAPVFVDSRFREVTEGAREMYMDMDYSFLQVFDIINAHELWEDITDNMDYVFRADTGMLRISHMQPEFRGRWKASKDKLLSLMRLRVDEFMHMWLSGMTHVSRVLRDALKNPRLTVGAITRQWNLAVRDRVREKLRVPLIEDVD